LFDETIFSTHDFSYLYSLRWGVETFFSKVKGRLALENFTGKSVESIRQDFWSTIFISNLETIMIEDVEKNMNANKIPERKKQKINKSVSFNVIKNMAFEIFFKNYFLNSMAMFLARGDLRLIARLLLPITVREKKASWAPLQGLN